MLRYIKFKLLIISAILAIFASSIFAQSIIKYEDYASQGNKSAVVAGASSTNKFPQVFPGCTVTVYQSGTLTLATLYADSSRTAKANPFTADTEGRFSFYVTSGLYDIRFSGTGITTPFTRSAIQIAAIKDTYTFNVDSYGAVGDGIKAIGSISLGGFTLISSSSVFTVRDVGKVIYIVGAGNLNAPEGINSLHSSTISAYVSPTQVTIANSAVAAVTNGIFYFGTNNQAAFNAAVAASIAAGNATFNANPVNSLGTPLSRGNKHGTGTIKMGNGNYIISSNITLPLGVDFAGTGQGSIFTSSTLAGGSELWSPYAQDYTAPINGIVQTAGFINGSTGSYNTIRDMTILAMDQARWQSCLDDTGSTYLRVERVRVEGCHWGQIMDQTELSSTKESTFESYFGGSSGKLNLGTAPENIGWTKVGSVASGVEPMVFPDDCWQCGRVTLSPTGTQTTYWKTGISNFSKGFLFVTQTPEVVGVSTDIGRAATQILDDGTHHFEINWKGYLDSTPLAANWAATTSYSKYQVAKATASVGGFTSGNTIYSKSTRTSSGAFDAAEAANWTSAVGMLGFKVNNTGPLYPAPFSSTALAINPGGATATLYLGLSSSADTIASSTIPSIASTGAMIAFGDFDATNNNNASVYWNQFEWQGTWPTATALWMPPNDDHWQHRETYTRTGAAMYSGDAQVICRNCTMGAGDVGKSVTVYGAGPAGANLTATINSYFGDGYVYTTATATPSDTSFAVTANLNIASPGAWLYSSGEAMYCTGSTATTVTGCTRGLLGSTARTFAIGDSLNVYRTWVLSSTASTSVGINSSTGATVAFAESAGPQFVNVIQVYNNQFNGQNIHIKDEGGYVHDFWGNNFNGGGTAYDNSGSYQISIRNSDFEGQSSWPIVLGGTGLIHPTLRGSAINVKVENNLLSSVKLWQGNTISFTNNQFTPGSGSAIYNSSGGGVGSLNASGNSTQGARLFQQNIGAVEGNRLGGLIPLSANGALGVSNLQTRYDRPVTGPLELHYRSNGNEEEARGALGAMTAGSKTLTITSKYSSTQFYSTDVGKTIKIEYAAAANGSNAVLTTTIAAYTSATQVTLTDAAAQTVTNVNTIWYREGAKTPAITFYDAYDLYGANWTNGPTTLSAPTLTISAVSDYSGTVAGTVRGTVNSIAANTDLTLALASVPWSTGSLTLKISGTTDYNHYAKSVTYIDDTHVYWTDTYTSSQTGTASYLAGTDPTAPASTLTPKNYFARIQGLSAYTANRTVNMLDASGYLGITPSLLTQNAWLTVDSSNRITGNTTYATLDPTNGQGMLRQLTVKAATAGTATDTMIALQAANGTSGWLWLYDYPAGWLTLQDGVASRQQMTVIANATYDYLQLHSNEGINWNGYSISSYSSSAGIARNANNKVEINRGLKIANGGATGDLILRKLDFQGSGASSSVYNELTGTPTAIRTHTFQDLSGVPVESAAQLTAGQILYGVAINSGVGAEGSSNFTWNGSLLGITGGATLSGTTTSAILASPPTAPAQITSDQDNYAPTLNSIIRLSSDASRNITGFASAPTGTIVIFLNVGAQNIVLQHLNAGSSAGNQFQCSTGADLTLAANKIAILVYDGTSAKWRVSVLP